VVLERLTLEELARHEKGIERIRRRLFRRYRPVDYLIVPNSERVIAASAESCWNAACGDYRVLRVGGLSYAVDCGDEAGLSRFSISHMDGHEFNFWLTAARGHTLTSLVVSFRELDENVYANVRSFWRSNVMRQQTVRGERRGPKITDT
jgi:hypothetical protein